MPAETHPFALAGFTGPFRFVRFQTRTCEVNGPWVTVRCEVCKSTCLDSVVLRDATGREIVAGCDCAQFAKLAVDEVAAIRKARTDAAAARRLAKLDPERAARLAASEAEFTASRALELTMALATLQAERDQLSTALVKWTTMDRSAVDADLLDVLEAKITRTTEALAVVDSRITWTQGRLA